MVIELQKNIRATNKPPNDLQQTSTQELLSAQNTNTRKQENCSGQNTSK